MALSYSSSTHKVKYFISSATWKNHGGKHSLSFVIPSQEIECRYTASNKCLLIFLSNLQQNMKVDYPIDSMLTPKIDQSSAEHNSTKLQKFSACKYPKDFWKIKVILCSYHAN